MIYGPPVSFSKRHFAPGSTVVIAPLNLDYSTEQELSERRRASCGRSSREPCALSSAETLPLRRLSLGENHPMLGSDFIC